ncbi:GlxA family transcriptional regulator [Rhodovastum atsumiense]|nr:GlxA family transcriptional regulator [Rhodovastum atsumiense]
MPAMQPRILKIGFVLANGFTMSAFALFVDMLRLAADEGDGSRQLRCSWSVIGRPDQPIRSSSGVSVTPTHGYEQPRNFDYVVLVGGILHAGPSLGPAASAYLHEAALSGVPLIGVCTGSLLLCREGLMNGRRCCVSWYHYQDFLNEFPDHQVTADRLFLVDGDRITCSGGGGVADLAAYLIERHFSQAVAQKTLHILLYDRARSAEAAQPHPPMSVGVSDERVRRGLLLMEQNIASPLPIPEIASRLGLTVRHLERLFQEALSTSPASAYRDLRLRYATWVLSNTDLSVTEVALQAGFADCAHFSRQFRKAYGHPPSRRRQDAGATFPDASRFNHRAISFAEMPLPARPRPPARRGP